LIHFILFQDDIKFLVGQQVVFGNKEIISKNCDYFKAVFAHSMKESQESTITVPDEFTFQIVNTFLQFLHGKNINLESESLDFLVSLVEIANWYLCPAMVQHCVTAFIRAIDDQNVTEIYQFAEQQQLFHLMVACYQFIENNFVDSADLALTVRSFSKIVLLKVQQTSPEK